ncbi:MAG TPA: efflux RND transporter periplasmic adaptor subunit [Candidatus Cryosericum sp.]|nr:efflux RND transporter periplasmic adaptor subunit [Candidatus Cryosericum sp.]
MIRRLNVRRPQPASYHLVDPPGRRAASCLLALLLPAGALACGEGAPATTGSATAPPAAGAARSIRVTVAPVSVRDVTYTLEAIGSIEAEEEVRVTAGVEGVVTRVSFREGDTVTTSSVLAEIDPEIFRLRADKARATLDQTAAQEKQALAELRRREELLQQDPPLVSAEEVERARQEAERLRAAGAEARAAWELAEQDRRRSIVHPLVAGVINRKSVVTGQHVESKDVLATLADTRRLRLRFKVSEQESVRLKDGMLVGFTTAAYPKRTFEAQVFHVSSSADPQSRMVECLARVEAEAAELKPGFFAEVSAAIESHKDAIVVPERAVLATDKGFVVYEVDSGLARQRQVSVGLRTKTGEVEILSGLAPNAIVVTDGGAVLRDGAPVETGPSS